MLSPFIGRKRELERLNRIYQRKSPNLVVINGRRRVGKSRLITEFAHNQADAKLWDFAGLAPDLNATKQDQLDNFGHQLSRHLQKPTITFNNWSDAFYYLSSQVKAKDIILFDEISWMADKDKTFIPKLKTWWDKETKPVTLFFCGSVSTWISDNILNSTAFFGRINLSMTLNPLSIKESYTFLKMLAFKGSSYEFFIIVSILGGIPWYLEQLLPNESASQQIKFLCFEKSGLLHLEFDRIFHDLFGPKGTVYKKILEVLKSGKRTLSEIREEIKFSHSGKLSTFMENLITAGFVTKQGLWSFKTKKPLKKSLYRISDPYIRFYLKVIQPNLNKINLNSFTKLDIMKLPGFDAHIGLQVENLLMQNRKALIEAIGLQPSEIVADGAYRQFANSRQDGCQIDYLIQTETHNLFICEFKFKRLELDKQIINEVESKIQKLKVPRGFSVIPVLFHIGGISDAIATSEYFYRIINIETLMD